jgi:hypothetical protein
LVFTSLVFANLVFANLYLRNPPVGVPKMYPDRWIWNLKWNSPLCYLPSKQTKRKKQDTDLSTSY